MSSVYSFKLSDVSKNGVENAINDLCSRSDYSRKVRGNVFIKVNLMSSSVVPGTNTSPWVFEAVLKRVRSDFPNAEITVGDADLATMSQLDGAFANWGFDKICETYGVRFVNLSKEKTKPVDIGDGVVLDFPEVILNADSKITMPVMKTHYLTGVTCCLKNQWGCIPRFRHQYHPIAYRVIPKINKILAFDFAFADGTIAMEGPGPRTGDPKYCDVIFAGSDLVSVDAAVISFMGFNPKDFPYLIEAEKEGIGSIDFAVDGPFERVQFKPSVIGDRFIFNAEMRLRKSPLKKLFFDTPVFGVGAFAASFYNTKWWHFAKGRKHAEDALKSRYADEFKDLVK